MVRDDRPQGANVLSLITPVQILPHGCRTNQRGKVCLNPRTHLDPHADPHGETSGRKQWNKQAATSSFLERKAPESLAAQRIEASEAVGKDEVPSSNLGSSSKTLENHVFSRVFALSEKQIRPHPYFDILKIGMRSIYEAKNHNKSASWKDF